MASNIFLALSGGKSGGKRDVRDTNSTGVAGLLGVGDVSASAAFDTAIAKKPNSVAALIRAARPTHEESDRLITLEVWTIRDCPPRHPHAL
jgi:hypothetical protein